MNFLNEIYEVRSIRVVIIEHLIWYNVVSVYNNENYFHIGIIVKKIQVRMKNFQELDISNIDLKDVHLIN